MSRWIRIFQCNLHGEWERLLSSFTPSEPNSKVQMKAAKMWKIAVYSLSIISCLVPELERFKEE